MLNAVSRICIYLLVYGGMLGAVSALVFGGLAVFGWVVVHLLEAALAW